MQRLLSVYVVIIALLLVMLNKKNSPSLQKNSLFFQISCFLNDTFV